MVAAELARVALEQTASSYSPRAQARLRIAATLLHFKPSPAASGNAFCTAVLAAIRTMAPERQEDLRLLVNWVEAYERTEAMHRPRHYPSASACRTTTIVLKEPGEQVHRPLHRCGGDRSAARS
jgi:hypothetical protein